jgi:pyrroloquinoline quinone biosynthesis protein B
VETGPGTWWLVNATPDVRAQIANAPALHPGGLRTTPLAGILLTDAELDHVLGLVILREGTPLEIRAPQAVISALDMVFPLRRMLMPYADRTWTAGAADGGQDLGGTVRVDVIPVNDKPPRYAADSPIAGPWTVAYRLRDTVGGGSVLYAPCVSAWTPALLDAAATADVVLVDGTVYSDAELATVGVSTTAAAMGHVPLGGEDGTIAVLRTYPGPRRVLVHINNTNPVLDHRTPEWCELTAAGIEVGEDGMEFQV